MPLDIKKINKNIENDDEYCNINKNAELNEPFYNDLSHKI